MKYFIASLLTFQCLFAFGQDYVDIIAEKSCACINEKLENVEDAEEATMKIGFCMLEFASPYQKKLKKDYGIDFAKIDKDGEKLGQIIGLRMASKCPMSLVAVSNLSKKNPLHEGSEIQYTGTIINIEVNLFVLFTVEDENGKKYKFLWLEPIIDGSNIGEDYKNLTSKKVKISYISREFFDPKIDEYRMFNVIQSINEI